MCLVLFWVWQDFDGQVKGIKGSGFLLECDEKVLKIEFSDCQFEYLMCISDVIVMLLYCVLFVGMFDLRQLLFLVCYQGMVEVICQGFFLDDVCEDWVMKKWFVDVKISERFLE